MSGRFRKAPLVYVTARVRTTELPEISSDQRAALEQSMIRDGFPELKHSRVSEYRFPLPQRDEESESLESAAGHSRQVTRRAFFNDTRQECLIIDADNIEFRTTAYGKYADFIARFNGLMQSLVNSVDGYAGVVSHEFVLSYADIIVPYPERDLSAYFSDDGKVLPLKAFSAEPVSEGEQRVGQVQITRVVSRGERIDLTLEQLPIVDGRLPRYLPVAMLEPDGKLSMPLSPNLPDPIHDGTYGLCMTQAAKLEKVKLQSLELETVFYSLHELTKTTFNSLLNREVCDRDWEYTESDVDPTERSTV